MKKDKVLVIEDESEYAELIKDVLSSGNYDVDIAVNGKIGLEKYIEFMPDLILCDINMPVMNGIEFLKKIRETTTKESLPVIMITAWGVSDYELETLYAGANDFIVKDSSHKSWLIRIQNQLTTKRKIHTSQNEFLKSKEKHQNDLLLLENFANQYFYSNISPENPDVFSVSYPSKPTRNSYSFIYGHKNTLHVEVVDFNTEKIYGTLLGMIYSTIENQFDLELDSIEHIRRKLARFLKALPLSMNFHNRMKIAHCFIDYENKTVDYVMMGGSILIVYKNGEHVFYNKKDIDLKGNLLSKITNISSTDICMIYLMNDMFESNSFRNRVINHLISISNLPASQQQVEIETTLKQIIESNKELVITGIQIY